MRNGRRKTNKRNERRHRRCALPTEGGQKTDKQSAGIAKKVGHMVRECRSKDDFVLAGVYLKKAKGTGNGERMCFTCGQPGHIAHDCT